MPTTGYHLVRLPNGAHAVRAARFDETMHPGLGPEAEAELLHARQLAFRERMSGGTGDFVVWDVGLGAAANALAVLRTTRDLNRPLRLESFDNTAEPLAFALENAEALGYLGGYEPQLQALLTRRVHRFTDGAHEVNWQFHLEDFPAWVAQARERRAPHAILFDAFSPAKNPAMWTLPLFTKLFRTLDPQSPCSLTTFSRSTMIRVTLLLAGFLVGRGAAAGTKEETTVAANRSDLIEAPLDRKWLDSARRSDSAEPMTEPVYRKTKLSADSWEKLRRRPQFS